MTKHEAVMEFFSEKAVELFDRYLQFNALEKQGVAIITDSTESTVLARFIGGPERKRYAFNIMANVPMSIDMERGTNIDSVSMFEEFSDWIRSNAREGNYPDFGEGCVVEAMRTSDTIPNLVDVDNEAQIARYTLAVQIDYLEVR
jgi:hypothetical protein